MQIAFIVDPLEQLNPFKDSSIAMMESAVQRGHQVYVLGLQGLYSKHGEVFAHASELLLPGEQHWCRTIGYESRPLSFFDVVMMRKDPPFDAEYLYATHLLALAEQQGVGICNSPQALRDYNEKLAILRHPEWIAPTLVARTTELIQEFLAEHQDIILKPLDGMGGAGIYRLKANDPNLNVILEVWTQHETRTIMAQRYLPEIAQGDKRVLLVGGKPVPYALARIPQAGETRGNLAAGGRGVAQALSANDIAIAEALGPELRAAGLNLVGLDIIGDCLTEINVTSPTCMREICAQTDCNPAELVLEMLEATYHVD